MKTVKFTNEQIAHALGKSEGVVIRLAGHP